MAKLAAKIKFNVLLIFLLLALFPNLSFAESDFVLNELTVDSDNLILLKTTYTKDTPSSYAFKFGVACDTDYGLGYIYNPLNDKYISYSVGKWEEAPTYPLNKNDQLELKGKVFDTSRCLSVNFKLRARDVSTSKYTDFLYPEKIILTLPIPTPSPSVIISPIPTPSISVSIGIEPTKILEESKDLEIEQKTLLTKEQKENVYITEFMPNPKDESEWVEIYNSNKLDVTLENWYVDDSSESGGTPVIFSTKIKSNGYSVVEIGKSLLNNTNDKVCLLDEHKNIIHCVSYKNTVPGFSIQKNLFDNFWYISKHVTKEATNINISTLSVKIEGKNETSKDLVISKPSPLPTTSSELNLQGDVLGLYSEELIPSPIYKTLKIYTDGERFTKDSTKSNYYIITEKEFPSTFSLIMDFLQKTFW